MELTDEQLVTLYRGGDTEALELLFKRNLSLVYNYAFRFAKESATSEDIAQEVFFKVWQNIKKFNQSKNFKTWLLAITHNTCLDYVRKKKMIAFSDLDIEDQEPFADTLEDEHPLPPELFDAQQAEKQLQNVIETLPERYKIVIFLYYREHLNLREISEVLSQPIDTVKSKYRRGLQLLRKALTSQ